ncbi:hypothetical protein [Pseudomaricurvus sp.]|uniref:hypothetical protein n=1 Tax=Pseudomaricurvus sp. TaxID=2004510 RepID=UPI003F6C5B92
MSRSLIGGLLCVWSLTAGAETSCPQISCNCESIPDKAWSNECRKEEQQLKKSCADGAGVGVCRVSGINVGSVELLLGKMDDQPIADEKSTIERGQLLSWAVREANTLAKSLQDKGDWLGALSQRKREAKGRHQLYQLAASLSDYYDARADDKRREALYKSLVDRDIEDAKKSAAEAESLWQSLADTPEDQLAVKRALAQKLLRNASDSQALSADAERRNNDTELSAELWRLSAEYSSKLLQWKREGGSSDKVLAFYRQRAAARWYQAGLMALMDDDEEAAQLARKQSEALWLAGK